MNIDKEYDFKKIEKKWQKYWEKEQIFKFNPKHKGKIYAVDTPPPTISGDMHIGHSSMYSQMDFIVRYHRLKGENIFYPFGTDDNGLPTEKLVERINNVKSKNMKRKDFVKLCLETLKKIRPDFIQAWKDIGISCDYSLYYSTINEHCQRLSQKSFIELYKQGREYRSLSPTLWCPECRTGVAQVDLEDKELESSFSDIIFKVGNKNVVIATTRPELLPACVAVFVHPNDKRYKKLIGKKAKVPLFNFQVPIVGDEKADPEKGTGIVMCCTFGDLTDVEWYKQHKLPLKVAITEDGKMTELAKRYKGMAIKEAREKIIEDLYKKKLIVKEERIKHFVNVHERCGSEIEILETYQWFVKYLDLRKKFLENGSKLKWYPSHMKYRYDNWVKGLQWDWCISRQRHFGIPFPVWYCRKCGEIILAKEEDLPVDPLSEKPKEKCKCGSNSFIPEEDVMDTWATSSLTPRIAIELVKDEKLKKRLFPMDLRPQAHDIITFWLFNTLVKSQLHYNKNPWKDIVISGFVLDPHGQKMSKSKGNIVEPRKVLDKYGADALRFWAASTKLGEDILYQEKDLLTGRKTVVKLWNASKFVLMNLKDYKNGKIIENIDKWLLLKLSKVIGNCDKAFKEYDYTKAKREIEDFFWKIFCDNYLEIVKHRLYNKVKGRQSAQYTLYVTLLSILKLLSPIMPYVTEEIYSLYFNKKEKCKSIHISKWPEVKIKKDKKLENLGEMFIKVIGDVRKFKTSYNRSLREEIDLTVDKKLKIFENDLKAVTNAREISYGKFNVEF